MKLTTLTTLLTISIVLWIILPWWVFLVALIANVLIMAYEIPRAEKIQ